jgi:hypothetical protein
LRIDSRPSSPLAVTLSVEPEWHRIDETGGAHVENYGIETKINADLELIKNRAYLGFNLLYEPEAISAALRWLVVQHIYRGRGVRRADPVANRFSQLSLGRPSRLLAADIMFSFCGEAFFG